MKKKIVGFLCLILPVLLFACSKPMIEGEFQVSKITDINVLSSKSEDEYKNLYLGKTVIFEKNKFSFRDIEIDNPVYDIENKNNQKIYKINDSYYQFVEENNQYYLYKMMNNKDIECIFELVKK